MSSANGSSRAAPDQRIGVFGGTFDPIHFAHLRLAEEVAERFELSQVRFIPARIPPHRASPAVTAEDRLAMTALAIHGNPRFVLDARECERSGPSYTVDSLQELRLEVGHEVPIALIMGMDAYNALTTWSRWQRLYELAHIVIAHRPGHLLDCSALPAPLARETRQRRADEPEALAIRAAGLVITIDIPQLDISATAIRKMLGAGHSARYLLPAEVLDYIDSHHLYKDVDAGRGD